MENYAELDIHSQPIQGSYLAVLDYEFELDDELIDC